jgi:hypothetical protein
VQLISQLVSTLLAPLQVQAAAQKRFIDQYRKFRGEEAVATYTVVLFAAILGAAVLVDVRFICIRMIWSCINQRAMPPFLPLVCCLTCTSGRCDDPDGTSVQQWLVSADPAPELLSSATLAKLKEPIFQGLNIVGELSVCLMLHSILCACCFGVLVTCMDRLYRRGK